MPIANQYSCIGEIDARCRAIPPNHKILLFTKGISTLSRISGHEHKKMCLILLGLIVDLPIPDGRDSSRIIKSVRALMDFVFLAQYKSHTTESIEHLEDCLAAFHDHKAVFVDLGIWANFNLPKLHSLTHYTSSIQLFGTTDNYNTEQSERLHIDFAKDAYCATNRKDEYPQMTAWLERREKMQQHAALINRRQQGLQQRTQTRKIIGPPCTRAQHVKMTRHPSVKAVSFDILKTQYGALNFQDALANFIALANNPGARGSTLRVRAEDTLIPFRAIPVFHIIKFMEIEKPDIIDSVFARPEQRDKRGRIIPSRFDTVLVQSASQDTTQGRIQGNSQSYSVDLNLTNWYPGLQIAQVRVVFQLPKKTIQEVCPSLDTSPPTHLAYVEWFSPLTTTPDPKHLMYRVSRLTQGGERRAGIIPVDWIRCSVHLLPRFGPVVPHDWNSFTVLEQCQTFYLNPFTDVESYITFA